MNSDEPTPSSDDDLALLERLAKDVATIESQIARVVVGQHEVVRQLLVGLLVEGHCMLVGVPGLAKTLLVRTLASTLDLQFKRIQFTPDLMPADVTGTDIIVENRETGERSFRFVPGPVFTNLLLADEINRTPPKTQAALLEAMQEQHVTIGGTKHALPRPFFVLATQNPLDQEGTYPLPEAQLDRFLFEIRVDYPSHEEELEIALRTTDASTEHASPVSDQATISSFQRLVRRIPIAAPVADLAVRIARATRPEVSDATDDVRRFVRWGAGPRASQALVLAAKANAAIRGAPQATIDDVVEYALPALRHRVRPSFAAEAEGVDREDLLKAIVGRALQSVGEPARDVRRILRSQDAG